QHRQAGRRRYYLSVEFPERFRLLRLTSDCIWKICSEAVRPSILEMRARVAIWPSSLPEDLAVIGYDNSSTEALGLVNLASIDQSGR
ncbi:hypothetical protein ACC739_37190, partial [Rhizobium ruizarguesonis]